MLLLNWMTVPRTNFLRLFVMFKRTPLRSPTTILITIFRFWAFLPPSSLCNVTLRLWGIYSWHVSIFISNNWLCSSNLFQGVCSKVHIFIFSSLSPWAVPFWGWWKKPETLLRVKLWRVRGRYCVAAEVRTLRTKVSKVFSHVEDGKKTRTDSLDTINLRSSQQVFLASRTPWLKRLELTESQNRHSGTEFQTNY
jgi:hypothetical protein